jgi:ubiquinol-cytochrome c reductase cytochrome c subunit
MIATRPREARTLSRILRVGLVVAVAGQIAWSFRPTAGIALTDQEALGRRLYEGGCISCHGVDAGGTASGPSLYGVGAASVDFYLSTGRMPLANPGDQPVRQTPAFTPEQISAIVAYLSREAPGGPAIPSVSSGGDLSAGAELYLNNCAGCHGAGASGDSVGGGQIAPSLGEATPVQIAEAVRIGPGLMPKFGEQTLDNDDVQSLSAYLVWLRTHGSDGGLQLGRVGAVAEGLVAIVIGLGLLLVVIRLTGTKT